MTEWHQGRRRASSRPAARRDDRADFDEHSVIPDELRSAGVD